jgi:hypothetical protein
MRWAYDGCTNLTGSPVCGEKVEQMGSAYARCENLSSNGYFYSKNVKSALGCFTRTSTKRLNLYVPANSATMTTMLNTTSSITGSYMTWTDDMTTNGCYYNTYYNIYIYPVANVAAARAANGD